MKVQYLVNWRLRLLALNINDLLLLHVLNHLLLIIVLQSILKWISSAWRGEDFEVRLLSKATDTN